MEDNEIGDLDTRYIVCLFSYPFLKASGHGPHICSSWDDGAQSQQAIKDPSRIRA